MKKVSLLAVTVILGMFCLFSCNEKKSDKQNWTHYVRIAGHGINQDNVDEVIASATESNVYGIEIDNSLTGYYSSFLNPDEKLKAIKMATDAAHAADNRIFVYIEGLEIITTESDSKEHTFFKDHPDWVQRNIDGDPAVFGEEHAFWISEGDEDSWISPFATEWKEIYMERVRQIAETGIDGIHVDIPYWMTHFEGWWDTWASFDDYTVAAFKELTGIDAKTDIQLGNYEDPNFIKWIDFRIDVLTQFMKEVDKNVKYVNPNCMTIAEVYPGLGDDAVRVGADVYEMYQVVDAIAHEYSEGGYTAAERSPFDWVSYLAGMYTFRAFAEGKASWMLSYSWDENEGVEISEAMENMILSHVMAGNNTWDARGHVMSGSNDIATRTKIFEWIDKYEDVFYKPRNAENPIGIYFSPKSRNYFPGEYIKSFFGYMHLLLTGHREFEIVTPRTIDKYNGNILILPNVFCLSDDELSQISDLHENGTKFIISGELGEYDEKRELRDNNFLANEILFSINAISDVEYCPNKTFVYYKNCPGSEYFKQSKYEYNVNSRVGWYKGSNFYSKIQKFLNDIDYLNISANRHVLDAPPYIAAQITNVANKPHIFLTNLTGLEANRNSKQKPVKGIRLFLPNNKKNVKVSYLPFLGEKTILQIINDEDKYFVEIPPVNEGGVIWYE